MAYQIGQIPTHDATPPTTAKVEIENPTGPTSEWCTIAELCKMGYFAGANGIGFASGFTTLSTTGVMAGCAGSILPVRTGKVLLIAVASIRSSDGGNVQLTFNGGTGPQPAQGDPVTGTQLTPVSFVTGAQSNVGAMLMGITALLSVGTTYWLDLVAQVSAGPTSMSCVNPNIVAIEL